MEIYGEIIKFLKESGKCLIIEDGKLIGVVLNVEEYEKLKETPAAENPTGEASAEIADIEAVDDVTLKDLGIDELPY